MNVQKYLLKKDINGNTYAIDNPEYTKYIQDKKYRYFLEKSEIPNFYWNISFEDYIGDKLSDEYKKIVYYANNCHKENFKYVSMYLWGNSSTQKTALACNIGKQAIKNGLSVGFILAGKLIDKLIKTQGYGRFEQFENDLINLLQNNLIIIDDFGDQEKSLIWKNNTSLILTEWDNFLRDGISKGIKFIITSNCDPISIEKVFSKNFQELIDRNFIPIHLISSVKEKRKLDILKVFEDM